MEGRSTIVKVKFKGVGLIDVYATFSNGEEKNIFSFNEDKMSFSSRMLIGLTEKEANDLYHEKI